MYPNTGAANGWTCVTSGTGGADPFICTYQGGLAVGASTSFDVTVTPRTGGIGLARNNTAIDFSTDKPFVADPDLSDNSSTVLVDIFASADMQVSKTASLAEMLHAVKT